LRCRTEGVVGKMVGSSQAVEKKKKKPKAVVESLLDRDEVLEVVRNTCPEMDEAKAAGHAARIVHQAFMHERKKVHRELLELARANPGRPEVDPELEFNISMMPDALPKALYEAFKSWRVLTTKVVHVMESSDYVTTKLLIELSTGNQVESVLLRHNKRTTLCISSQVGCKMGCTFCATGTLGQRANLTGGEIQEQLFHANRFLKMCKEPRDVTNIVFMGMGEPLNNYKAVVAACQAMIDTSRFSLSASKVTVSTVGVVNRMRTLHRDVPGISLALSLHAPNQELRLKIIPTAGAYPIPKLMEAMQEYIESKGRDDAFVMIEYILLSGVNDMPEIAHELGELLKPFGESAKVNLIPYNPIFNAEGLAKTFKPPTEEDIATFQNIVQNEHNIFCTVRTEMGQDANAACGQLACVSEDAKSKQVDIEDLYRERRQNKLYDDATGENINRKEVALGKQVYKLRNNKTFNLPSNQVLVGAAVAATLALAAVWARTRQQQA